MLIKGLYIISAFKQDEGMTSANIKLNKDHEIFKGHFPGNPVMPGVCMIQIIKELTEKAVEKKLFLSVCTNVKFMAIINPEEIDDLVVNLQISEDSNEVIVKNITSFNSTLALKLNATFKII